MSGQLRVFACAAAAFAAVAGCSGDLPPSSRIANARVLGARVGVTGDPSRAWPGPGESADVSWLIGVPKEPLELTWGFIACVPAAISSGVAFCDRTPFGIVTGGPSTDPPQMRIALPPENELLYWDRILLLGIFCTKGAPTIDAARQTARCTEGDTGDSTTVSLTIPIQRSEQENHNPNLQSAPIGWNDEPWDATPADSPLEGCATRPDLRQVAAGSENARIRIALSGAEREEYTVPRDGGDPQTFREEILVSHFTTAGKMTRQFAVVERNDPSDPALVDSQWEVPKPKDAPPEGKLVRFYFVVRDQRGGLDWVERAVCLTGTEEPSTATSEAAIGAAP